MEENKTTLSSGEYCEALLDICQFLHCEMQYFLECDGRFRGGAKTYWCNMREAWKKMNRSVTEEDIELYGQILFILRSSIYKEFSRLKVKRLSAADRIIVIIKKTIEIAKEYMKTCWYMGGGRTGILRRIGLNEPSLTVLTSPGMKQTDRCHPLEVRPFSYRENARIQTFPDDWVFCGRLLEKYKQIGNAVPVNLAKVHC